MRSPRRPERPSDQCPICGESTYPIGNGSVCEDCGSLLEDCREIASRVFRRPIADKDIERPLYRMMSDSMDLVEFQLEVEDRFGVDVLDFEQEKLLTLGELVRQLRQLD